MRPRPIALLARSVGRRPAQRAGQPEDRTRTLGQSLVEFALILPVMLLLVAAAVDLGRLFYAYVAIENAAKEGALYGAKHPLCADNTNVNCSANGANVQYYVENEAASGLKSALGTSLLTTGVTCRAKTTGTVRQPINDCLDGDTYQVRVTYDFRLVTPILSNILGTTITLSSTQESHRPRRCLRPRRPRGPRLGRQCERRQRDDRRDRLPGRRHRQRPRLLLRSLPGPDQRRQLPPVQGGHDGQLQGPRAQYGQHRADEHHLPVQRERHEHVDARDVHHAARVDRQGRRAVVLHLHLDGHGHERRLAQRLHDRRELHRPGVRPHDRHDQRGGRREGRPATAPRGQPVGLAVPPRRHRQRALGCGELPGHRPLDVPRRGVGRDHRSAADGLALHDRPEPGRHREQPVAEHQPERRAHLA